MNVRSPAQLAGFALRAASLGSRFVFVLFAAVRMGALEFGIYGLVASASAIILQIAGLELYQVTLRAVARNPGSNNDDRAHYGSFMLIAAGIAALSGIVFAGWFGWSPAVLGLVGGICAAEYLGTEAQRICVVEGRPDLAMFSVSLRYLPWNLGLPVASLLGLAGPSWWTIDVVLTAWLLSSIAGSLLIFPVLRPYRDRAKARFHRWFVDLSGQIPRWILIALCYRFLETGVRLVPGILIDERAAGRFVLLATLAGIGSTGVKAVLEPFWFVRLIQPGDDGRARREFGRMTIAWLSAATVGAALFLVFLGSTGRIPLDDTDFVVFAILLVSSSCLSLSQVPHYALYARDRDTIIQHISLASLLIGLAATTVGTIFFGLIGTACGAAAGCASLLFLKEIASRQIDTSSTQSVTKTAMP